MEVDLVIWFFEFLNFCILIFIFLYKLFDGYIEYEINSNCNIKAVNKNNILHKKYEKNSIKNLIK